MASASSRAPKDPADLRGNLALTRISDVLAYLSMSGRDGVLSITKMPEERTFRLQLRKGKVVGIDGAEGNEPRALEAVLAWNKGEFRFSPDADRPTIRPPPAPAPVHESTDASAALDSESKRSEPMAQRDTTTILADMLKVPGIQAVVIIGRDGFVIEAAGSSNAVDLDALGASLAAAVNAVEETGTELSISAFQDLFIEYGRAVIICRPLGDAVVAMVTPDASKLGIIRHKVKSHVTELSNFF